MQTTDEHLAVREGLLAGTAKPNDVPSATLHPVPTADQIRLQLKRIVESVHFRSSRRYPALLGYIVEETLSGRGDALKERTVGVEVFGRPHDYDTNLDPVVRVTAGKIRQRLSQYYSEPGHEHEIQFRLHLGSYMPHFEFAAIPVPGAPLPQVHVPQTEVPATLQARRGGTAGASDSGPQPPAPLHTGEPHGTSMAAAEFLLHPAEITPATGAETGTDAGSVAGSVAWLAAGSALSFRPDSPQRAGGRHSWWTLPAPGLRLAMVAAGVLLVAAPLFLLWSHGRHVAAENSFWEPFLASEQPLLFVLGVHSLNEHGVDAPEQTPAEAVSHSASTMLDSMTRTEMVSFNDAISYSDLVSLVTRQHHKVRTLAASSTTLEQLRQGPVVLLGGFNNPWTLRLTSPLRYHFVALSDSVHLIADREHPTAWQMDTAEMAAHSQRDYAIIARFQDSGIDQPVLVAAGIGKSGTEAAAEFLTTKTYLQGWLAATHASPAGNVEIVIETDLINGQHGAPHVVASCTW